MDNLSARVEDLAMTDSPGRATHIAPGGLAHVPRKDFAISVELTA